MKKILPRSSRSSRAICPGSASRERGVALIVVLWIAAVLGSIVLAGAYVTRVELRRAWYPVHEMQALGIAGGGIEAVRAELCRGKYAYHCLNQKWKSDPERYGNVRMGEGTLSVRVDDEESKLNVNTTDDDTLKRLAAILLLENPGDCVNALADWKDWDAVARQGGAEESYYQQLEPPRRCKNAPLDCLDEITLIKGWENAGVNALKRTLTAFSCSKVNVNTAPAEVLAALPGMDAEKAQAVISRRSGEDRIDGTADDTPFASENEVSGVVGTAAYAKISGRIAVTSSFFAVRSMGRVGNTAKTVEAVLQWTGKDAVVRYWREL